METFKHYSSIENTSNSKAIQAIREAISPIMIWIATEKIHGCNFSAITDGNTIKWGKRSSYLEEDEMQKFNNSHYIKEKYSENIKNLLGVIHNAICVRVYGELCGGKYNNVKTSHPKDVKGIQKGIQYSPDIEFVVFDIIVQDEDFDWDYMSHHNINKYCNMVGLKSVQILHHGTLDELLQLDPTFQSTISSYFNLPPLENNMAEGYVFKPNSNRRLKSGGRIILKHKSPHFCEKNDAKVRAVTVANVDVDVQDVVDIISMYVNINRINNVMSKHSGIVNEKRKIGLIYQDVIEDAKKDFDNAMMERYNKHRSIIIPAINFVIKEQLLTEQDPSLV